MATSVKTEAVVLRKLRYSEADSILHLYTKEFGRVNAIAKGTRRSSSRFGGRLEPLFRVELMLHEGKGDLATVTGASTVDGYSAIRTTHAAMSQAASACDAVLRLLDLREQNEPAYNLLCNFLAQLNANASGTSKSVGLAFRLKLLLVAGFAPELGSCASCGSDDGLVGFSASAGGAICEDCLDVGFRCGEAVIVFMRAALAQPLASAPEADVDALRVVDRAINEMAAHHANVQLRTIAV